MDGGHKFPMEFACLFLEDNLSDYQWIFTKWFVH